MREEKIEISVHFSGKVQGVGFRWTVVARAKKFGLTGNVKNLPNGEVLAVAQGSRKSIESWISSLLQESENAVIQDISSKFSPLETPFSDFKIIY